MAVATQITTTVIAATTTTTTIITKTMDIAAAIKAMATIIIMAAITIKITIPITIMDATKTSTTNHQAVGEEQPATIRHQS